jgi:aryl-alcohol dehydrogenase-like predicted oxidoreductase
MEYRRLGNSGLQVPVLSFGTATFGGRSGYEAWGSTDAAGARQLVDICLEAGVTMFDTANAYSSGLAEEILATAIGDRRGEVLISTKASLPMGTGANEGGSSRLHLVRSVEESLGRLDTDWIDLLYMHLYDATTPIEEVVSTLDSLVASGKVRYVGASNFPGWPLMKSLAVADRLGAARYVAHQVAYSLAVRDYEFELAALGVEEGVGAVAYSPLMGSALTGKIRRGRDIPTDSRYGRGAGDDLPLNLEKIYEIVDVLDDLASETGRSLSQVAINWLLSKQTVSSVVLGARTEEQLRDSLGAVGWSLTSEQVSKLDAISSVPLPYPYQLQHLFPQFLTDAWPHRAVG